MNCLLIIALVAVNFAPSQACVDLVNPSTGVSDCPFTAYLCNNAVYYTLMTQQCPATCGRCAPASGVPPAPGVPPVPPTPLGPPTPAGCVDLVNPTTGISDCPSTAYLCDNAVYYTLMTQQCPATCGRCPGGRK